MALYTLYPDLDNFAAIGFDEKQITDMCGDIPRDRFDFHNIPKSFKGIITTPLNIDFSGDCDGLTGTAIPNLQVFHGKMFLSEKAYQAIGDLISNDGEFYPVTYENGKGYIFNPLSIAEDVDGLDKALSIKNEWDDIENIAFHEDKVKQFALFRTAFDTYINLYCNEDVKNAIEKADLKGLNITPELGAEFGMAQNQKSSPH